MFAEFLKSLIVARGLTSIVDDMGHRREVADNAVQIITVEGTDIAVVDTTRPNGSGGFEVWADTTSSGIRKRIAQRPTQIPQSMQIGKRTITIKHEGKA